MLFKASHRNKFYWSLQKDEQLLPEDELFHRTPRKLMTKIVASVLVSSGKATGHSSMNIVVIVSKFRFHIGYKTGLILVTPALKLPLLHRFRISKKCIANKKAGTTSSQYISHHFGIYFENLTIVTKGSKNKKDSIIEQCWWPRNQAFVDNHVS